MALLGIAPGTQPQSIPTLFENVSGKKVHTNNVEWLIDSGASNHWTGTRSLLLNMKEVPAPIYVTLPDDRHGVAKQSGSVRLSNNIIIHNVLLIPSFNCNLLSVNKLCESLNCLVIFFP